MYIRSTHECPRNGFGPKSPSAKKLQASQYSHMSTETDDSFYPEGCFILRIRLGNGQLRQPSKGVPVAYTYV